MEYHYGALLGTVLYRMVIAVSATFASLFAAAFWLSLSTPPCAYAVLVHVTGVQEMLQSIHTVHTV